ncbi:MAG: hypothetical protein ACQEXJ_09060 [Myxococcota bacterium]
MSEPALEDVLARLGALEDRLGSMDRSLARLVELMEAGASSPAKPRRVEETAAAPARPANPPASSASQAAGTRPAGASGATQASVDSEGSQAPPSALAGAGPDADMEQVLTRMFEAALVDDDEQAFELLTALTHSRDLSAPRALDHLKAFSWKKLRRSVQHYLADGDPASFEVERTSPTEPGEDTRRVKIFVLADGKSPAPVTLERDDQAEGAWRLSQVSL